MVDFSSEDQEQHLPAYRFGYEMANDQRYKGKAWHDVEQDIQEGWQRRYDHLLWDDMREAVQAGFKRGHGAYD